MENRIYVSIPLDALIVSGITSDCAVQISAMDGAILIERCDDDCENFDDECNCCDCICDECRAELAERGRVMLKIYRVLGKKGRITIPFEIRQRIGFRYNDVLSFNQQDDGSVLVRREKLCDNCQYLEEDFEENYNLEDFLDSLSEEEQRDALLHLSLLWAEKFK